MLGVIRNLVLDFILCYWNLSDFILAHSVTASMRKYPIHVTSAEVIKESFLTKNLQQ